MYYTMWAYTIEVELFSQGWTPVIVQIGSRDILPAPLQVIPAPARRAMHNVVPCKLSD